MKKLFYLAVFVTLGLWSCKEDEVMINAQIETNNATDIGSDRATVGGSTTSDFDIKVISRGVVYNTTGNPEISKDIAVDAGSGLGSFTVNLVNLDSDTEYFARAYATTDQGTAYGNSITFTTLPKPFEVISHDPADNATNVAVDKKVKIVFSSDIDIPSISNSTFSMTKSNGESAGQSTLEIDGGEMVVNHSSDYLSGEEYTIRLTTGMKSTKGVNLESPYEFSFSIVDNTAPEVTTVSVPSGQINVDVSSSFQVTFTEPVTNASAQNISLTKVSSGGNIASSITTSGSVVTISPNANLQGSTLYSLKIPTSIEDFSGNKLQSSKEVSFTTESLYFSLQSTNPEANATDIDIEQDIVLTFSANIDPSTVNKNSVWLSGFGHVDGVVPATYSVSGNKVTMNPNSPLYEGRSEYIILVDKTLIKDVDGNSLDANVNQTFKTEVVSEKYYYSIRVKTTQGSGQALTANGSSDVILFNWNNFSSQIWEFKKNGEFFEVRNLAIGDSKLVTLGADPTQFAAFMGGLDNNGNPYGNQLISFTTTCETCPSNTVNIHNYFTNSTYSLSNQTLKMVNTGSPCCQADHLWKLERLNKIQ